MPKPRTKRGALREERKRKRRDETNGVTPDTAQKRQRTKQADDDDYDEGYAATGDVGDFQHQRQDGLSEREFFGMLAEEEQEYFRRADEMLELNQFPTTEERDLFLESVFREAQGKELKLASSQSCSRLMERLIQLSSTRQKKHLFDAFAGHFLSLVRHRFASHCCEALFLRSAGLVSQELAGFVVDTRGARTSSSTTAAVEQYDQHQPESSMEQLFLATLDELEGSLSFLLTDKFASHTLRVLLVVLSGRPLQEAAMKTLMRSRKKERVWVAGAVEQQQQQQQQQQEELRAVPASFTAAIQKIIADSTAGLDATGLRVLAKHPVGNPTLQLLLELDMTLNKNMKKKPAVVADFDGEEAPPSLLLQLLPDAPESLSDPTSEAAEFVNGMVYDQIGSRLVETLVQHCPGKIFRHLNQNFFLPRIEGYVRNDIACYPAIRVLERLGRDQLVEAVDRIVPTVPQLVSKARFNVLKTLFERCAARQVTEQAKALVKAVKEACGPQPADLVTTLCRLGESHQQQQQQPPPPPQQQQQEEHQEEVQTPSPPPPPPSPPPPPFNSSSQQQQQRHEYAIQSHGAALLTALLAVHGLSKAVHESLLAVPSPSLLRLATTSLPTVTLLTTALRTPCPPNAVFQKTLVARLAPHVAELATSQFGHNLVNAIAQVPCKGKDVSVPYHVKEAVMLKLAAQEQAANKQRGLRESWMGRSVWRTWKGDMWRTRPVDWKAWAKDMSAATPQHQHQHQHQQPPQKAKGKVTALRKDRHLVAV
ncbi:Armadillo-type fold protein [Moelleriella libera RCEF 2490]|uniref:Nucleolar protein 9 n=1 Tax=Moelleriella libera RCEF 2490 TaxID=1081109 RepID=A0A168AR48_9HYPO|nr:Armadillo-type fold protein [Moelleriella libera RCEF 2490]